MLIRKRSFFEILLPFTVLSFLSMGVRFVDVTHLSDLRFLFIFGLFSYLLLNKALFFCLNSWSLGTLLVYMMWCVSTIIWSGFPLLSFTKGGMFVLTIITMVSAGSMWILKFGYERALYWLFFVMIVTLCSGLFGGGAGSFDLEHNVNLYTGLTTNANNFGFLCAIAISLILWQLYRYRHNRTFFLIWLLLLILDARFLFMTYSRSAIGIFFSILFFFAISFPLSKKILTLITVFFVIIISLLLTPASYIQNFATKHILKYGDNSSELFNTRMPLWENSYKLAMKGGIFGGGFGVKIDASTHVKNFSSSVYSGETGNAQLDIIEETGIVGFLLYLFVLASFFTYVIPYYRFFKGPVKVIMGIILGVICGLLLESLVEGWWDSLGSEVICYWTFIGVVYGIIYNEKRMKRIDL